MNLNVQSPNFQEMMWMQMLWCVHSQECFQLLQYLNRCIFGVYVYVWPCHIQHFPRFQLLRLKFHHMVKVKKQQSTLTLLFYFIKTLSCFHFTYFTYNIGSYFDFNILPTYSKVVKIVKYKAIFTGQIFQSINPLKGKKKTASTML